MRVWPGKAYPLGATWNGEGVNFALFSENATAVELCLFDGPDSVQESHRVRLEERTNQIWHAYLPGASPNASSLTRRLPGAGIDNSTSRGTGPSSMRCM